jgi:hypothetical protein
MKFMKQSILAVAICMAFVMLQSCKKEDIKQPSKTDLVTAGPWQMFDMAMDDLTDADPMWSFWPLLNPCGKDDITNFSANGTGTFSAGPTKCDPDEPNASNFSWSFTDNETKLIIDSDAYYLVEFSSSQMILELRETDWLERFSFKRVN